MSTTAPPRVDVAVGPIVRPGDTLILALTSSVSQQLAAEFKEQLGDRLPGLEIVIVSNCSGVMAYRPEPGDG